MALVKLLMSMGRVTEWVNNQPVNREIGGDPTNVWGHVPCKYYIARMVVRFFPDAAYWEVGSFKLSKLPDSEADVRKAIIAARTLMLFKVV